MKLVSFKKMNKQKKIIIGSIVGILLIIGSIMLYKSYALYKEEKEFNVLKGKIPDFGYDIKMLSVVVDGNKSKTIPSRGLYKTQIDCSNGTRGEWDYNAWNLTLENVSENARCNITFTSNLSEEEYNQYIEAGKALRRNTYRGKDITSYLTAEGEMNLYTQISSGRFDDIYVGDYIVANNITWLVADIDNYLNTGDTYLSTHHLTIIPSKPIINAAMNSTNTAVGGYYNSQMKQTTLPQVLNTYVKPVFGNHIITYRTSLSKSISENAINAGFTGFIGASDISALYDSQIDLMSEMNVYGTVLISSSAYHDIGIDNMQYAIFQLKPELRAIRNHNYWLRSVVNNSSYAFAGAYGEVEFADSTLQAGVRPRFLIG